MKHLLLSLTENCETLIKQTHINPEEPLEFELTKSRKIFHFKPPVSIEGSWMLGLLCLEVYKSIFNKTEENNNFELFTDTFDEFSFTKLKDELEEILDISNFTPYHLQDLKKWDHT